MEVGGMFTMLFGRYCCAAAVESLMLIGDANRTKTIVICDD